MKLLRYCFVKECLKIFNSLQLIRLNECTDIFVCVDGCSCLTTFMSPDSFQIVAQLSLGSG